METQLPQHHLLNHLLFSNLIFSLRRKLTFLCISVSRLSIMLHLSIHYSCAGTTYFNNYSFQVCQYLVGQVLLMIFLLLMDRIYRTFYQVFLGIHKVLVSIVNIMLNTYNKFYDYLEQLFLHVIFLGKQLNHLQMMMIFLSPLMQSKSFLLSNCIAQLLQNNEKIIIEQRLIKAHTNKNSAS